MIGASLPGNEPTSSNFDVTLVNSGSTYKNVSATLNNLESTLEKIGATSSNSESSPLKLDTTLPKFGAMSSKFESTSDNNGVTSTNLDSSSSIRELASLIRRSAKGLLKIFYCQPNIPERMAGIVLALQEKKKLSVSEMRQITVVSRNSLVRDLRVLKLLGSGLNSMAHHKNSHLYKWFFL